MLLTQDTEQGNVTYPRYITRLCHLLKIQNKVMSLTQDTEQGNVTYSRYRTR